MRPEYRMRGARTMTSKVKIARHPPSLFDLPRHGMRAPGRCNLAADQALSLGHHASGVGMSPVNYLIIFDVVPERLGEFLELLGGALDAMRSEPTFREAILSRDPEREDRF